MCPGTPLPACGSVSAAASFQVGIGAFIGSPQIFNVTVSGNVAINANGNICYDFVSGKFSGTAVGCIGNVDVVVQVSLFSGIKNKPRTIHITDGWCAPPVKYP